MQRENMGGARSVLGIEGCGKRQEEQNFQKRTRERGMLPVGAAEWVKTEIRGILTQLGAHKQPGWQEMKLESVEPVA